MKYLLVLGVVLFGIWLWRHNRETAARERAADQRRAARTPPARQVPPPPAQMIACAHCGLHLPEADAVTGREGSYCTHGHRRARED